MKPNRLLLAAASTLFVSQVMAGEAVFYIQDENGLPMDTVEVSVDGQKQLAKNGYVIVDIAAGSHKVEINQFGEWLGEFAIETSNAQQNAEILVDVIGGEALEEVSVYTPGDADAAAVGQISGELVSAETGGPVKGASVMIAGTEMAVVSDEDGFFQFELPRGSYTLTVKDPNYGSIEIPDVRVLAEVNSGFTLTMSLQGEGPIEEVVATGSYTPTAGAAQERDATAVLESIGAEQMARFGDSNAASALKRVAGVSVVGGQFAVVRGLQGRYIASTLNGGVMPSTDPMRRDVPLDLFPASVLGGIDIQKTFTPEMPGDATGGIIMMDTKGFPDGLSQKLSISTGINNRTTFNDVISYEGGGADFTGVDDGTRDQPSAISNVIDGDNGITYCTTGSGDSLCTYPEQMAAMGTSLRHKYALEDKTALPDFGISYSQGDVFEGKNGDYGYYSSVQYSNKWDARHNAKTDNNGEVGTYERSKHKIDFTGYLLGGYEDPEKAFYSRTIFLRKTDDTTKFSDVDDTRENQVTEKTTLQWVERQFISQQFAGDYYFNDISKIDWRVGYGQTRRDEPDRITYQYINGVFIPSTLERRYSELTEDVLDLGVDYVLETMLTDDIGMTAWAGFSMSTKERDVTLERVGINTTSTGVAAMDMTADVEELVNDAAFNDGYLIISNRTTATDSYGATDDITALYGSLKFDFADFQVLAGARYEDSSQSLSYPYSGSGDNTLDSTEVLPALNVNWFINEDYQLRFAASNTLSRPGITERSDSVQYDPETDDAVYGNPDLVISKISNLDIRLEYYMEEDENITLALFTKAITDPIERTVQDGSGSSSEGVTFENQDSADLMGLELDFRVNVIDTANWTGFVAGNFSYIDAEVTLSEDTAKLEGVNSRKLQGQSENLSNLQIGFDHEDTGQSVTLLLNHFSERIYAAGRGEGQDAVVEDGRMSVDLAYNFEMNDELSMKAKIGNITDAKVSYSQGGQEIESYQEGIDISAGVSYQF